MEGSTKDDPHAPHDRRSRGGEIEATNDRDGRLWNRYNVELLQFPQRKALDPGEGPQDDGSDVKGGVGENEPLIMPCRPVERRVGTLEELLLRRRQ